MNWHYRDFTTVGRFLTSLSEHSFGVENDGASDGVIGGPDPEGTAVL